MMSPAGAVLDSPPRSADLRAKTGRHRGSDANSEESLVRAARPVLDQLALDLDGTTVGVVLTDATGHVLHIGAAGGADGDGDDSFGHASLLATDGAGGHRPRPD